MAQVLGGNKVKLNDGKVVNAQTGGWYDGQQFWDGTLSNAGQINSKSNQQGAGSYVSPEVNRQSSVAQGLAPGAIDQYLAKLKGTTTQDSSSSRSAATASSAPSFDWQSYMGDQEKKQEELKVKQKAETDARFAGDKAEIGQLVTDYKTAVPQVVDAASEKYQLGDLLSYTNALNTRIKDLQFNTSGTGGGGYTSASRVDKAVKQNYMPNYLTAQENLQRGTGLAQNEIAVQLSPYKIQAELVNDRMAREATGYDKVQQRELDSLLTTLATTGRLAEAEMDRLTKLSLAEQDFNLKKYEIDKSSQYLNAGAGKIYDTTTGQWITAPGSGGGGDGYNIDDLLGGNSGSNKPGSAPSSAPANTRSYIDSYVQSRFLA